MRKIGSSLVVIVAFALPQLIIFGNAGATMRGHFAEEKFQPAPVSWWECRAEAQVRTARDQAPEGGDGLARLLVDAKRMALDDCAANSAGAICVIVTCHHPCQSDCGG